MTTIWETRTGMTREQVETLYIGLANELMKIGATEEQAKKLAEQKIREIAGL